MESNFIYASYKLLVELAEGALWVWNAQDDYHGTTANSLKLQKPSSWGKYAEKNPDVAQWTLVSVLPRAVTGAAVSQEASL